MRTAALFVALLATPVTAQDAVSLKWSLKEGDKFFVKDDSEMNMTIGIMGLNQDLKMNAVTVQRFKVVAAKQDSTTIEMTILGMELKSGGAVKIPGLSEMGERLKDSTITAVLDDNMAVTKFEGYDKFLDKISGNDADTRKLMKAQYSEASMSQMFNQVFSFGNNKPVKVGDTWSKNDKMSLGGVETGVKMKYKLDSISSGIAKCGYTGDLTFKAGAGIPGLPAGIQIDKFDMKADKFGGNMKFDTKAGRLSESAQDADMNGSMTLALGGQKFDMTMKIKTKQKVTVDDKNPLKD